MTSTLWCKYVRVDVCKKEDMQRTQFWIWEIFSAYIWWNKLWQQEAYDDCLLLCEALHNTVVSNRLWHKIVERKTSWLRGHILRLVNYEQKLNMSCSSHLSRVSPLLYELHQSTRDVVVPTFSSFFSQVIKCSTYSCPLTSRYYRQYNGISLEDVSRCARNSFGWSFHILWYACARYISSPAARCPPEPPNPRDLGKGRTSHSTIFEYELSSRSN